MSLQAAYFCYPSAYSLYFLNRCLRRHELPIQTVLFSRAAGFASGRPLGFHQVVIKTLRESGLRYGCYELAFTSGSAALLQMRKNWQHSNRRLMTFGELRKEFDLKFHRSWDFNDEPTRMFLQEHGANCGLSAFNNQLFKSPIIEWFQERNGLYNVHPALLPDFRGVEPIVPLLLNKQSMGGVTLHSVDTKIDRGTIHYQQEFDVVPQDSVFSVNHKAWREGSRLAKLLIEDLSAGNKLPMNDQAGMPVTFGYCPFPSREMVRQLRLGGHRLIRARHLGELLGGA